MIVDAHMHLWDRVDGRIGGATPVVALRDGRIRVGERELLGMPALLHDCRATAERALAEFDAAGVDVGIVVQEYMDGPQNDYLLEVAARHPQRFFGHALPDFFRPDQVVAESFAWFERGLRGLKLSAAHLLGAVELDDRRFFPLWERMQAEQRVLAADLAAGGAQAPAMERILTCFPRLPVALGHFGMVTRGDWLRQVRLARHEQVYVETGGVLWLFRREGYPFRGAIAAIQRAKAEVGIEKLMWGSDWPRTMVDFTYRQALAFLRDADHALDAAERRALLGANAARLYRLAPRPERAPLALITED